MLSGEFLQRANQKRVIWAEGRPFLRVAKMSEKKLIPITRAFLKKHYEALVIDPEPAVFAEIRLAATQICTTLHGVITSKDSKFEDLRPGLTASAPKRIDENFYRNREQCERICKEILTPATMEKLESNPDPELQELVKALREFSAQVQGTADSLVKYQKERQQAVEELVRKFLPNDFRMTLLTKFRERSERKNTEAIESLRRSGASIHQVFNALWEQQMARRATLVQLGEASGAFKMFLKLLAGVPQVLLDFVRTINDEEVGGMWNASVLFCTVYWCFQIYVVLEYVRVTSLITSPFPPHSRVRWRRCVVAMGPSSIASPNLLQCCAFSFSWWSLRWL